MASIRGAHSRDAFVHALILHMEDWHCTSIATIKPSRPERPQWQRRTHYECICDRLQRFLRRTARVTVPQYVIAHCSAAWASHCWNTAMHVRTADLPQSADKRRIMKIFSAACMSSAAILRAITLRLVTFQPAGPLFSHCGDPGTAKQPRIKGVVAGAGSRRCCCRSAADECFSCANCMQRIACIRNGGRPWQ